VDRYLDLLHHYCFYFANLVSLFVIFHLWVDACWLVLEVSLSLNLFAFQISFLLDFHFQLFIHYLIDLQQLEADSSEFTLSLTFILPIKF